jgi:DNA-binding NarL/FixJ family response regulator
MVPQCGRIDVTVHAETRGGDSHIRRGAGTQPRRILRARALRVTRMGKDIAVLLSISPATVETHRAHLLQKLRLHNTVEVVRYAARRGIIQ